MRTLAGGVLTPCTAVTSSRPKAEYVVGWLQPHTKFPSAVLGLYLYSLAPTELLTRFMGKQSGVAKPAPAAAAKKAE